MCWGGNDTGQVTASQKNCTVPEDPVPRCDRPVPVSGSSGAVAVRMGGAMGCTQLTGGSVSCWGIDVDASRGHTEMFKWVFAKVSGIEDAKEIAVGAFHGCARQGSGEVACWSRGLTTPNDHWGKVPAFIGNVADASAIAAGGDDTCAIRAGGTVACWRSDPLLTDGTKEWRAGAMEIRGLTGVARLTVGFGHSCAVTSAGAALCWGDNRRGQLGDGAALPRNRPVVVIGLGG